MIFIPPPTIGSQTLGQRWVKMYYSFDFEKPNVCVISETPGDSTIVIGSYKGFVRFLETKNFVESYTQTLLNKAKEHFKQEQENGDN